MQNGGRFTATIDPEFLLKRSVNEKIDNKNKKDKEPILAKETRFDIKADLFNIYMDYALTEKAEVNFTILNASGKKIGFIASGIKKAGQYKEKHHFSFRNKGIFYININAGRYSRNKILLKVK